MAREVEVNIRILGGLPVLAKTLVYPPEPDVGIMGEILEDVRLYWKSGSELSPTLYGRIKEEDWNIIYQDMCESEDFH